MVCVVCVVVITSQSGVGSVVLRAAELIEQSCVCVCVCVCVFVSASAVEWV